MSITSFALRSTGAFVVGHDGYLFAKAAKTAKTIDTALAKTWNEMQDCDPSDFNLMDDIDRRATDLVDSRSHVASIIQSTIIFRTLKALGVKSVFSYETGK
jgi:hypothetical protein